MTIVCGAIGEDDTVTMENCPTLTLYGLRSSRVHT